MDMSAVPQTSEEDGKNVFRFFWWDAYEDERSQPGVVLLFGKTFSEEEKKFVSCSVVVKNIQRKVYLLPRPFVSIQYYIDWNYLKVELVPR